MCPWAQQYASSHRPEHIDGALGIEQTGQQQVKPDETGFWGEADVAPPLTG